jgi:hypothetical protein
MTRIKIGTNLKIEINNWIVIARPRAEAISGSEIASLTLAMTLTGHSR